MSDLIADDRPVRDCAACGQHDDHPRCSEFDEHLRCVADYHPDCHQALRGDADCHPQCAGGTTPGPGAAMLAAITAHHEKG